jgi:hypothetical protein
VAIFIAQLALPRMKAANPASQIKSFVRLFAGHAPENTPVFFFRHTLTTSRPEGTRERHTSAVPPGRNYFWTNDSHFVAG